MLYNILNSKTIRTIDMCGKLKFYDAIPHPNRTLSFHDLVYVINGGFNVIVEDELIECRQGDIMFLPAYKHHYPNSNNLKNSECYYILFKWDNDDYVSFKKLENASDSYYCVPSKLNTENNIMIESYFHELCTLSSMNIKNNTKLLDSILSRILSEIDFLTYDNIASKYNELTTNIISLLLENLDKQIKIEQLASTLNFSTRTIQKHFKSNTNKTIHEYHLELKLTKSKYFLITYPNMHLREIAILFGFYDEFHYSKAFKKLFGMSPSKFKLL